MKKLTTLILMVVICGAVWGQNLEEGKVIEYNLPAEDNNTGTFYLGKFLIGEYEISANITGIHANNSGWKIFVSSGWSGSKLRFKEVFSNVDGSFIYQKEGNAYFHLWWDAKYGSGGQMWTPHIKVEYQAGSCIYYNNEPDRSNYTTLQSKIRFDNFLSKSGDAILTIEADSDNNNEGDNPIIQFRQDGSQVGVDIGFDESNFGGNVFGICRRYSNKHYYDGIFINTKDGNVGIGKLPSNAKLNVAGNIKAHEIEVTLAAMQDLQLNGTLAANNITYTANGNTADFVFEDNYHLKDLTEVEAFIKTNKHLPEIPSATEMEEVGVNLAEMNKLLLMKVEELTLYSIQLEKEVKRQKAEVSEVRSSESEVRKEMEKEREERRVMKREIKTQEERLAKMEALIEKLSNR